MTGLQLAQYVDNPSYVSTYAPESLTGGLLIIEQTHMDPTYFLRSKTNGGIGITGSDQIYTLGWSSMKMLMSNSTNANMWYRVYYIHPRKDLTDGSNVSDFYGLMTAWLNNGGGR